MSAVILAEATAYEVKDMLKAGEMPDGYLKIKVNSGRCTGLTYGVDAEEAPGESDEVLEYFGSKVLVNRKDASVLNGTTISFRQSLMGDGFQIDNPSAIASCNRGNSFRTAKVAGNPENC